MVDELDVLRKAFLHQEKAIKILRLNDKLFDEIIASVIYIMKYAEKNNITLPNKENLYNMVKRAEHQFDIINKTSNMKFLCGQPTGNTSNNHLRGNST